MKKIFTLLLVAVCAICANAQNKISMLDPNGKVYGNGETMKLYAQEDPEWGDIILPAPLLKNNTDKNVSVTLDVKVVALPAGTEFANCFAGSCVNVKNDFKATNTVPANGTKSTQVEWNCWGKNDYVTGTATLQFTIYADGIKESTVTVDYINDPTGVHSIEAGRTVVATYNTHGQRTQQGRGLLIQKLANGKTVKVLKK